MLRNETSNVAVRPNIIDMRLDQLGGGRKPLPERKLEVGDGQHGADIHRNRRVLDVAINTQFVAEKGEVAWVQAWKESDEQCNHLRPRHLLWDLERNPVHGRKCTVPRDPPLDLDELFWVNLEILPRSQAFK